MPPAGRRFRPFIATVPAPGLRSNAWRRCVAAFPRFNNGRYLEQRKLQQQKETEREARRSEARAALEKQREENERRWKEEDALEMQRMRQAKMRAMGWGGTDASTRTARPASWS